MARGGDGLQTRAKAYEHPWRRYAKASAGKRGGRAGGSRTTSTKVQLRRTEAGAKGKAEMSERKGFLARLLNLPAVPDAASTGSREPEASNIPQPWVPPSGATVTKSALVP